MKSNSQNRAKMPVGTSVVLDARSLEVSNSNLLLALKPGDNVLDVGCGSGPITMGISNFVGDGKVLGIDSSRELIESAVAKFKTHHNLSYLCADIIDFHTIERYDVITAARTLQWLEAPERALKKMKELLSTDGIICILDYNHCRIEWDPLPPKSMLDFYAAFLDWRAESGMNNKIGDHMPGLFKSIGMEVILFEDFSEYLEKGMYGFERHIDVWNQVARLRGNQLVRDGWIDEDNRQLAIKEYAEWCKIARSMKLCLKATHAVLKQEVL